MRRGYFNIAELFKTHCCLSQKILALGPTPSLKCRGEKGNFQLLFAAPSARPWALPACFWLPKFSLSPFASLASSSGAQPWPPSPPGCCQTPGAFPISLCQPPVKTHQQISVSALIKSDASWSYYQNQNNDFYYKHNQVMQMSLSGSWQAARVIPDFYKVLLLLLW